MGAKPSPAQSPCVFGCDSERKILVSVFILSHVVTARCFGYGVRSLDAKSVGAFKGHAYMTQQDVQVENLYHTRILD